MPEKISILKESGETLNSNVVSVFLVPDTQKKYIITTENAVDPHGLTVLHVSEIVDGILQKVATDDEWLTIKTIMRAIISGNVGTFKYLPVITSIKASGQYSRDISVSASASKQMIDNYSIGDKSDDTTSSVNADANVGGGVIAPQNMMPAQDQNIQPSSIFPTESSAASADDELIPGIAEVSNSIGINQNAEAVQSVTSDAVVGSQPVVSNIPVNNTDMNVSNNAMNQDNMMNQNITVAPVQNVEMTATDNPNLGVQLAGPTQVVPTAQIAQEAQTPATTEINFDNNAVPSFAPNATLDEVVAGAQQMFMEGVKNLVQTIQEKVYRDLYAKEAELKAKEAELLQKEQMLNSQMAMMGNGGNIMNTGMAMNQMPVSPTPVATDSVSMGNASVGMNQNMMNNQMSNVVVSPVQVNQMDNGVQASMQMNGVAQNQPVSPTIQPMPIGPMAVTTNNDLV